MPLRRNSATFANWISYAFWLAPCFITSLIACTLMTSVRSLFEIEWWFGKIGWVHNEWITLWLYKKKEKCRKLCIINNSKITLIYSLCWLQVSHVSHVLYSVAIYKLFVKFWNMFFQEAHSLSNYYTQRRSRHLLPRNIH